MKIGSVYGGIGSGLLGAKWCGMKPVYLEDNRDWSISETIFKNFNDICISKEIGWFDDREVDIIIGQPPCKAFSSLAVRKKNRLDFKIEDWEIYKFLKVIQKRRPKYFILENLTSVASSIWINEYGVSLINYTTNEKLFIELKGYNIQKHFLNAKYYNVPQNRERLFIIGDLGYFKYWFPNPKIKNFKNLKDILKGLDNTPNHIPSKHSQKRVEGFRKLKIGESYYGTQNNRRLDPDKPAPTMTSHRTQYVHPWESRVLTVREVARCQGFPDDFIFYGPKTLQYDQAGSSIVPQIIEDICKQILRHEDSIKELSNIR